MGRNSILKYVFIPSRSKSIDEKFTSISHTYLSFHFESPAVAYPKPNIYSFWPSSSEKLLQLFFGLAPLFLVTIRSWSSAVLILGSCASIVFLMQPKRGVTKDTGMHLSIQRLLVFTLLLPVIAIALSSMLRGSHVWAAYDSPARFFFAIAIFLFAVRSRINIADFLQYTAPSSLVLTLLHQIFFHQPKLWGPDRMSTYFSDPLVFGYTSLTLGLVSLVSINLLTKDSKPILAFKLMGAGIGFYLSIMSGSRTGWLAVPIILAIWIYKQERFKGKYLHLLALGLTTSVAFCLYVLSATVHERVLLGLQEVIGYSWVGIAPETSVGLRITFLRIAFDMFLSSPLAGFGDTRYELTSLPQHIYTYASPESLRMAFTAGFHNEIVTNAIRSGVGGLVSGVMLFAVPLFIFVRQLCSTNSVQRANALIGVVFTVCICISSMSTEVFDLKYTASFYALMIALLCASAIAAHEPR